MSSFERRYVPLSEIKSEQVLFNVKLPSFVDQDKIAVNIHSIEKLCQLGGIQKLAVIGKEDLDTSEVTPQIVGFNDQGTAYMGKAKSKTAELSRSDSVGERDQSLITPTHAKDWINTTIEINMDEVKNRISNEKNDQGVRSEATWANYLNKGIKMNF